MCECRICILSFSEFVSYVRNQAWNFDRFDRGNFNPHTITGCSIRYGWAFRGSGAQILTIWGVCASYYLCRVRVFYCNCMFTLLTPQFGMLTMLVKERLYLGEAPLALVFGIIIGMCSDKLVFLTYKDLVRRIYSIPIAGDRKMWKRPEVAPRTRSHWK